MISGRKITVIDIGSAGYGHPAFDLASLYSSCCYIANTPALSYEQKRKMIGFDIELAPEFWREFCENYFNTRDSAFISQINSMILPLSILMRLRQDMLRTDTSEEQKMQRIGGRLSANIVPMLKKAKRISF